MFSHSTTLAALIFASRVFAQTYTNCNPLNSTDCPSDEALGMTASFNWTSTTPSTAIWNWTSGSVTQGTDSADFVITEKGDSPTVQSLFYIFFGRVSTVMKAASGQGIVSSIVLESDDLDEVDWEMIGGNSTYVETNFFGKGNTSSYDRDIWYPVDNNHDYHNYTTVWTAEKLEWYIDGTLTRTLNYNDSLANYGKDYPQTPMYIKIGIWAGGDTSENSNGTVEWAGGATNYSDGPFTMSVQSVEVEDFSSGKSYTYSNKSGDWQSITIADGNSTIKNKILKDESGSTTIEQEFNSLTTGEKLGIAVGASVIVASLLGLLTFCCVKQRRLGRREKAIADAQWERQMAEVHHYKRLQMSEQELHPRGLHKPNFI